MDEIVGGGVDVVRQPGLSIFRNVLNVLEFIQKTLSASSSALLRERSEKNGWTSSSWQGESNNYSLQRWWVKKHLSVHNQSNIEADWNKQQKDLLVSAKNRNLMFLRNWTHDD